MVSSPDHNDTGVVYKEACDHLYRALALIDTIDDMLLAAQLSHVVQLLEDRIPSDA